MKPTKRPATSLREDSVAPLRGMAKYTCGENKPRCNQRAAIDLVIFSDFVRTLTGFFGNRDRAHKSERLPILWKAGLSRARNDAVTFGAGPNFHPLID